MNGQFISQMVGKRLSRSYLTTRERQAVILWQRIHGTNSISTVDWNQLKFKGDFSDMKEDFIHLKLFKGPGEYISSSNVA